MTFVYVECSPGYFGLDCIERCSGHCIYNERCDHVSGFCPRGCIDGHIGRHCNICKIWKRNCRQNLNKFIFIKKIYNDFELTFYKCLVILFFMPSFCFLQLANLGIMVETVLYLVLPTVRHVDTQMVCVRVGQVGWVIIAQ